MTARTAADYVQNWGPGYRSHGILVDHLVQAGVDTRVLANGALVALVPQGKAFAAANVLCGDLVWDYTEDGRVDVRCGGQVYGAEGFACPGHTAEREGWLAMSEAEKADWERHQDELQD